MTVPSYEMPKAKQEQFREEGYCVLERIIPEPLLALLRDECQGAIDAKDAEMDRLGTDTIGISHRGKRYFVANSRKTRPEMDRFLFSDLMAGICRGTLGPDAWLFYEQYVVKGAEGGMRFSWHQDSGYVNANGGDIEHRPYLTCWCPLDDVSEENGTVYLLPMTQCGIRTWVRHVKDPASNDWVGYFGSERGVVAEVPAGSIVLFSSMVFHSSGANLTPRMRRVYLAQYSAEPILTAAKDRPWANAVPFLQNGEVVARPEPVGRAA